MNHVHFLISSVILTGAEYITTPFLKVKTDVLALSKLLRDLTGCPESVRLVVCRVSNASNGDYLELQDIFLYGSENEIKQYLTDGLFNTDISKKAYYVERTSSMIKIS